MSAVAPSECKGCGYLGRVIVAIGTTHLTGPSTASTNGVSYMSFRKFKVAQANSLPIISFKPYKMLCRTFLVTVS